jgi:hypothetical protein
MIAVLLLVVFSSFSVQQTALDQRSTSHADTGNRALFAAESGILHALNTMNASGVIDFKEDVSDRWSTIFGTSAIDLVSDPNSDYRIVVTPDATDPTNRGTITATGRGPLLARRMIQVDVAKGGFAGAPGALHLADPDDVDADFRGNAFDIDGNNYDRFGNPVNDGILKPAISALGPDNVQEVVDSLNSGQVDNVRGLGFDPVAGTPSVAQTGGPDNGALDQFVADILARPGVVTTNVRKFNGNDTFGTPQAPQITYMTDPDVWLNGNAQGAGILIADGSIRITGTLDFIGLIIVRGNTVINAISDPDDDTLVLGNAMILGSLWTGNLEVTVGGSAIIDYCHECLWLVDQGQFTSDLIPRPMRIVSWRDL